MRSPFIHSCRSGAEHRWPILRRDERQADDSLEQTGRTTVVLRPELRPGRPAAQLRRQAGGNKLGEDSVVRTQRLIRELGVLFLLGGTSACNRYELRRIECAPEPPGLVVSSIAWEQVRRDARS